MDKIAKIVIYPVSDLTSAKAVFSRLLGEEPTYDDAYYVGYELGDHQIGLDPHGKKRGMTGATPFWEVEDIQGEVAGLVEAGARIVEDIHEVGGGAFVAILADADDNMIGLIT